MKENIVRNLKKAYQVEADRFAVITGGYVFAKDLPIDSFTLLEIRQNLLFLKSTINNYEAEANSSTYANSNLNRAIELGKQLHKRLNKLEKIIKKMEEQANGEFTR